MSEKEQALTFLQKEGQRWEKSRPESLRDQYAMAALPALIASHQVLLDTTENMSFIVQDAFTFADLCMEERDK